jgi:hypothetical protein
MKPINLQLAHGSVHAPMVQHLVQSYANWWGLTLEVTQGTTGYWGLSGTKTIVMPANPRTLIPKQVAQVPVLCAGSVIILPFPQRILPQMSTPGELPTTLPEDLFAFLCGQLWRAEELEPALRESAAEADHRGFLGERYGFFDTPIVDLWMRSLFEAVLGSTLLAPTRPRFWMTYDIDCLRKWRFLGVLKHIALLPLFALQGKGVQWLRLLGEALHSWSPRKDPWFTIPRMLKASQGLRSTFFFLAHPRDH